MSQGCTISSGSRKDSRDLQDVPLEHVEGTRLKGDSCFVAMLLDVCVSPILSRYKTDYEGFFISNLRSALQAALNFLCFFVWIPRIWAFLLPLLLSAILSCRESYVVAIETSFCGNNAVHG